MLAADLGRRSGEEAFLQLMGRSRDTGPPSHKVDGASGGQLLLSPPQAGSGGRDAQLEQCGTAALEPRNFLETSYRGAARALGFVGVGWRGYQVCGPAAFPRRAEKCSSLGT